MRSAATMALLVVLAAGPAHGERGRPAALRDVAFDQRIGDEIPLGVGFRDERGRSVRLGEYFGEVPVVIVPAYYECPMLCPLVLSGVASALRVLPFDAGKDFRVVVFSFNPRESPAVAAEKKKATLERYGRSGTAGGWHFLTGEEKAIRRLTGAIGFRYRYDPKAKQYAHAAGLVVTTPGGRISHYFYGVEYPPRDLRLALVEASANKIGSPVDQILLFCFRYDPTTGRYSRVALRAVRLGGVVILLTLGTFVGLMLRREARRKGRGEGAR